jgi:4-amino-4-deoxy-L-arabinose transferase-like glycosyltransferase
MKAFNIFLVLIFSFYIISSILLQTIHPPVWPDEAIYAEVVQNVITSGKIKSNLWKDAIINIQTKAMWNPPLFFYEYALWQRIWGVSIYYQRALVQIVGFSTLFILYLLTKKKQSTLQQLLPLTLWVTNIVVAKSTRLARPEMFVLMFGLLGMYLVLNADEYKKNTSYLIYIFAGLAFGMTILHHIIGIIFIAGLLLSITFQIKSALFKKYLAVLLTCLTVLLPWLLDIYYNWNTFSQQFKLSSYPRSLVSSWLQVDVVTGDLLQKIIILGYIALTGYVLMLLFKSIFFAKQKANTPHILAASTLIVAWILSVKGKSEFYSIYPITLTILATHYFMTSSTFIKHKKRILAIAICVLIAQSIQTLSLLTSALEHKYVYEDFARAIALEIPESSSVFLTAIPDPYYGLVNKKGIALYEFPAVPIARDKYLAILNSSDYIVYNGHFEAHLFGDFMTNYIKQNLDTKSEVHSGGYNAFVFKLVDRSKRVTDF